DPRDQRHAVHRRDAGAADHLHGGGAAGDRRHRGRPAVLLGRTAAQAGQAGLPHGQARPVARGRRRRDSARRAGRRARRGHRREQGRAHLFARRPRRELRRRDGGDGCAARRRLSESGAGRARDPGQQMKARALRLDDEVDRRELWHWALAALIMLAAHLGIVATYLLLHRPDPGPSGAPVVVIDLAPYPSAPRQDPVELPPDPPMQEAQPEPERKAQTRREVLPRPPIPTPEVVTTVLPAPEQPAEKKVEDKPPPPKPVQAKKRPAPRTTPNASAPTRADAPASSQLGVSAEASRAQAAWRGLLGAPLQRAQPRSGRAPTRGGAGAGGARLRRG